MTSVRAPKIARSTIWIAVERGVSSLSILLVSILVARFYSIDVFGQFSFALAISGFFMPLVIFGLEPVVMKYLSDDSEQGEGFSALRMGLLLSTLVSVFLFAVCVVSVCLILEDDASRLLAVLLSFRLIFSPVWLSRVWFQLHYRYEVVAGVKVLGAALSFVAFLFVIYFDHPVSFIAQVMVVEAILTSILLLFLLYRISGIHYFSRLNLGLLKKLFAQGLPLAVSSLGVVIYHKSDILILGLLSSSIEVAIYSASARLYGALLFVPAAISTAAYPLLLNLPHDRLRSEDTRIYFSSILCTGLLMVTIVLLFRRFMVVTIFGEKFSDASMVLAIHATSAYFACFGIATLRVFYLLGKQNFVMLCTLAGAVINIFLNILLIPLYGALGAAVATLFSTLIFNFVILFLISEFRSMAIICLQSSFDFGALYRLMFRKESSATKSRVL